MLPLVVEDAYTLFQFKRMIEHTCGLSRRFQQFIDKGQMIDDEGHNLKDNGLCPESMTTLHCALLVDDYDDNDDDFALPMKAHRGTLLALNITNFWTAKATSCFIKNMLGVPTASQIRIHGTFVFEFDDPYM